MDFERKGTRRLFFKATDDLNFELRIAGVDGPYGLKNARSAARTLMPFDFNACRAGI